MEIKHELRTVDRNTIFMWVNVGRCFEVTRYDYGTRDIFKEAELFQSGQSKFVTVKELYDWAFDYLGYKK